MKLLFDQNLSGVLVAWLADLYPHSAHVRELGLDRLSDRSLLQFARTQGYTLVLKERDLAKPGFELGLPSKLLWLNVGNCSTRAIEGALRLYATELIESNQAVAAWLLVIG